eukprot:3056308-Amphidinium_carterae.1
MEIKECGEGFVSTGSVVASIIAAAAEPSPCGNTAAILAASEAAVKPRFDPTRGAGLPRCHEEKQQSPRPILALHHSTCIITIT